MRHVSRGASLELGALAMSIAVAGLALGLAPDRMASWPHDLIPAFAFFLFLWIAVQDAIDLTIPDGPVAGIAVLAIAAHLAARGDLPVDGQTAIRLFADPFLGLVFGGGGLYIVREVFFRRRGVDGVGFGDVKLAAACGLLLGITGFAYALLAASLSGLAFAGARMVITHDRSPTVPFGAFLAPICWCIFLIWR